MFSTPTKHNHAEFSFSSDLEDLGIEKEPVYSHRIKQTFTGLVIDEAGSIEVEDSDDDYQETSDNIFIKPLNQRKPFSFVTYVMCP